MRTYGDLWPRHWTGWRRNLWRAALLAVTIGLAGAACTVEPPPPEIQGPPEWRITVSPIEPAAGIKADVTMQRTDDTGKTVKATIIDLPPHARALELTSGTVVWSDPAVLDGRGVWLAPIVFPAPGRWQIVIHEAIDSAVPVREGVRLSWPSVDRFAPAQVVRDAIGEHQLSLIVTVIPDRGPILWWLRTHVLETFGIVVVLMASLVSYRYGRTFAPVARR